MALQRVAAFKTSQDKKIAALLVADGRAFLLRHNQVAQLGTDEAVGAAIEALAVAAGVDLPPLFAHINRDGSLALATGERPDVWPEDYPAEDRAARG